ncbi:MAG TPA: M13 family metallopeptidase, partial [Candidatus Polarisedimenticolia bacterium]|nr:M13 family metallopeptidase [Candidatus Polarisedimenticolia bacterium]
GLPDRDYYLKDDDQSKELRKGYEAHVTKMLSLLGEPEADAARHAAQIVAFETELAKESRPSDEMRNLEKLYHKIDITGLKALTPDLPWERYLAGIGYPGLVPVNAGTPEFLKGLASIAKTTQPDVLQAYLRWQLVSGTAPLLSKAFVDENFAFFGAKLSGQQEIETRWKRCVTATDAAMGELLGQAFIDREFPGDSKAIAVEMIHSIEAAFEAGLPSLTWMDDATRKRALDKMKAITNKIGYPDTWRDYSGLAVTPASYFDNSTAARVFEFKHEGDKIGKPRDRKEWGMTPPTVNAYYNPTANEIVFPAGVLQRPFFHRDFPIPMNFGGIGMVMGHELTHGFDDQGRKFDPSGQMSEWWDPEVVKKFEERAQCVDDLYDTYEVLPGVHLNGKLTLGENIADLGGVKEAYNAYKMWVKKHGEPAPTIEGVTNDQLFFLGFAQSWCVLETPEYAKMMANVNPHSAARFRVIGPLSNLPAFSEAFGCKEGSPMRPAKTCEVW